MRRITHLHGSAHFTIPLRTMSVKIVEKYSSHQPES